MTSVSKSKTFTAGHGGSRIRTAASIYRFHRRSNAGQAGYNAKLVRLVQEKTAEQTDPYILDLGCGSRAAVPLGLVSLGLPAIGMDYDTVAAKPSVGTLVRVARTNGIERAVKTAARMALFDRAFYSALEADLGVPLDWNKLRVEDGDAHALRYDDETFSFIHSVTVFEHLHDVPKAVEEMHRVLRPGGKAYVVAHLFPSPSGGHALDWAGDEPPEDSAVPAWDHLRENRFPAHVYLNKLRADEYVAAFERYFEIEELEYRTEGQQLLTDELRAELSDWSEEDLTRRLLTVTLRKAA